MAKAQLRSSEKFLILGLLTGIFISGILAILITSININSSNLTNTYTRAQVRSNTNPVVCIEGSNVSSLLIKININLASIEELDSLPGIGEIKAKSIISFREKYGDLKETSELLYVPGISDNIFQQLCAMITVNQ